MEKRNANGLNHAKSFSTYCLIRETQTETTLKAIEEEKMPYPQIINSQKIAVDLYGVRSIPEIILFAPDGTILARGLRGDELGKKLKEIFGE